ncbi:cupin domain-containing protein [candidate division KSB1 bacterium]
MKYTKVNFAQKFNLFQDHWSPKIIAEMNNYQFKLVKLFGEFVWHSHDETDEVFIVFEGNLTIEFEDGKVNLASGDMFVVPKGVRHKSSAKKVCKVMVVEPEGTLKSGDKVAELDAIEEVWI